MSSVFPALNKAFIIFEKDLHNMGTNHSHIDSLVGFQYYPKFPKA
jgi:hypothetical protein